MPTEIIRRVRVAARRDVAEGVIELELEGTDGAPLIAWEPGAHIDLRLGDDLVRQYSLIPAPSGASDRWAIAVLVEKEGRGGSRLIARDMRVGVEVNTSGPRNHFAFVPGERYHFIAGGIGVTPLIAMCRAADAAGAEWTLAYLGRSRTSMAYAAELEAEFGSRVEVFATADARRYDAPQSIHALAADTHVYCCGPERLMDAVADAMRDDGRLPYVHLEHFHPAEPVDDSENEEFTVHAVASDIEFVVPFDESVLMAADFAGVVVPGDCLEGTCGSCETRVIAGEIDHRDSILGPQERLESRTMMICVSRAARGCPRLELDL